MYVYYIYFRTVDLATIKFSTIVGVLLSKGGGMYLVFPVIMTMTMTMTKNKIQNRSLTHASNQDVLLFKTLQYV